MSQKISVRVPDELIKWLDAEGERRNCDRSVIINDALRLAATAVEVRQVTEFIKELTPLITNRLDRLENYTVQSLNFSGALARNAGVFDQAQAGFC